MSQTVGSLCVAVSSRSECPVRTEWNPTYTRLTHIAPPRSATCRTDHSSTVLDRYTPDNDCGSVGVAAGANVAADAVATANCASRRPRVPTVSRTTAHSGSGRGVATRAPLYVHKRLSFLPTLMFCCYAASKGNINRLVLHLVSDQLRVLPLFMTLHATCQLCHRFDFASRSTRCSHRFCSYISSAVRLSHPTITSTSNDSPSLSSSTRLLEPSPSPSFIIACSSLVQGGESPGAKGLNKT